MAGVIYIVIPVFNRWHFSEACLLSLREQTYTQYKAVVVDDGSTDGTPEKLAEHFPEAKLLKTRGDLFWTATTNVGIRYALEQGADWVLTLNNDTLCPPEYLAAFVPYMKSHPTAIQGSVAIDQQSGLVHYAGERHNWLTDKAVMLASAVPVAQQVGLARVSHFPGRGCLIPRAVFEAIGLFDEDRLPHYLADHDFTHQASLSGFPCYINFDARLITYPEASGGNQLRRSRTLSGYWKYITSIRGGANLRDMFWFTVKNCPWYLLPTYLALGFTKRTFGYFKG